MFKMLNQSRRVHWIYVNIYIHFVALFIIKHCRIHSKLR